MRISDKIIFSVETARLKLGSLLAGSSNNSPVQQWSKALCKINEHLTYGGTAVLEQLVYS